jgi:hypothetical protein
MNFSAGKLKRLEEYLKERISLFYKRLAETKSGTGGDYHYQLKSEIDLLEGYLSLVESLKTRYPDLDQNGLPEFEIRKMVEIIGRSIQTTEDALSRRIKDRGHDYQTEGWEGELDEEYALRQLIENLVKE